MNEAKGGKALVITSYILIYLVWGSTYFFIKAAVETIPAPLLLALRFLSGGILLLAFCAITGKLKQLPSLREVAGSCLTGTLLLLMGNGLITMAEKSIPSYMASLLAACMPFLVAFFNFLLFRKKVSALRLLGVALGVAGVALLLYDGDSLAGTLSLGVLLAVAGVLSWSFGTSTGSAMPKARDSVVSTAIQMLFAGSMALALGGIFSPDMFASIPTATPWSWFGLGYLALMGSVALVAYNFLLARENSFRLSSYALVNPLIAVVLGLAAGEAATPFLYFGFPLILLGIAMMLYGDKLRERLSGRATGTGR